MGELEAQIDLMDLEGERRVKWIVAFILGASILVTTLFVVRVGFDRLPIQILRFVIEAGLCHALLRRSLIARMLVMAGGGLTLCFWLGRTLGSGEVHLPVLALTVGYAGAATFLLLDSNVRHFFRLEPLGITAAEPPPASTKKKRKRKRAPGPAADAPSADD